MSKVVDKPRPSNPLDEIIAHAPHEPRSVGEGPNGGLALWKPWALDTLGTGCLQRPKAVAARLVVVQRVGAPERVAKIQRACVRNSECGRMRGRGASATGLSRPEESGGGAVQRCAEVACAIGMECGSLDSCLEPRAARHAHAHPCGCGGG